MAIRRDFFGIEFRTDGSGRVTAEIKSVGDAAARANTALESTGKQAEATGASFGRLGGLIKGAIGAIGVAQVVEFATRSVVEFQKVEAQLVALTGSQQRANQALAQARAETVQRYLTARHSRVLAGAEVRVQSQGACCYAAANDSASGRAANRRVEVIFERDGGAL